MFENDNCFNFQQVSSANCVIISSTRLISCRILRMVVPRPHFSFIMALWLSLRKQHLDYQIPFSIAKNLIYGYYIVWFVSYSSLEAVVYKFGGKGVSYKPFDLKVLYIANAKIFIYRTSLSFQH